MGRIVWTAILASLAARYTMKYSTGKSADFAYGIAVCVPLGIPSVAYTCSQPLTSLHQQVPQKGDEGQEPESRLAEELAGRSPVFHPPPSPPSGNPHWRLTKTTTTNALTLWNIHLIAG